MLRFPVPHFPHLESGDRPRGTDRERVFVWWGPPPLSQAFVRGSAGSLPVSQSVPAQDPADAPSPSPRTVCSVSLHFYV